MLNFCFSSAEEFDPTSGQWTETGSLNIPRYGLFAFSGMLAWSPQPIDDAVLHRAREVERRYRLSWCDCLIVAAAQIQNCSTLLTEDLQDGMIMSGLRVQNPFASAVGDAPLPQRTARRRSRPSRMAV